MLSCSWQSQYANISTATKKKELTLAALTFSTVHLNHCKYKYIQ